MTESWELFSIGSTLEKCFLLSPHKKIVWWTFSKVFCVFKEINTDYIYFEKTHGYLFRHGGWLVTYKKWKYKKWRGGCARPPQRRRRWRRGGGCVATSVLMGWSHDLLFCWGGHATTSDLKEWPCGYRCPFGVTARTLLSGWGGYSYLVGVAAWLLCSGWDGRAADPRKKSASTPY